MNIDWSKAPEDATHKDPDTDCFYKLVKDVWHLICGDGESVVSASIYNGETKPSDLIERPKKQDAWDGGGDDLPPIGTVCEHAAADNKLDSEEGQWFKVEIIAHHKFNNDEYKCAVWVSGSEISYSSSGSHFRPIKTAEQLEEEEKVAAIAEMRAVVMAASGCTVATISECLATVALYEAGYRKQ